MHELKPGNINIGISWFFISKKSEFAILRLGYEKWP